MNKNLSNTQINDYLYSGSTLYRVIGLTPTQIRVIEVPDENYPSTFKPRPVNVNRSSGKLIGVSGWCYVVDDVEAFIAERKAEREAKLAKAKARDEAWRTKLQAVADANPEFNAEPVFGNLRKVEFANKRGQPGVIIFSVEPTDVWPNGHYSKAPVKGVQFRDVTAYVVTRYAEVRYGFSQPGGSSISGTSEYEILIRLIAALYWD